ncbi:MAG: PspC domain-containing protein [Candidatus Marinimicrobia bacterium]|nr:PspC domain-containing protein [Candidatus Neomarinimicrobiota bacterium]
MREDKTTNKKLYRSINNSMIGGVMAGIADYFNIDVTLVRVLYVFITIFSAVFPAILVYLICWAIIPSKKIFS